VANTDLDATAADQQPDRHLDRQLSNRHIQLIAIGGAIGTGLFMGSGKTISLAGPSVLFVYMIVGFMLYFVMRAMGELLLSNLHYKSFADFASDLLGPCAGFFTGWTYWFCWIVTGIAEVIAIAGYVTYWWHDLPLWIPALAAVVLLIALNLPTVKAFGETEFWFALIKIVAIVVLIVVGLVMILTHFHEPNGTTASFTNLWKHGGFFPTGPMGFIAGFEIATFAFVGIELVGTTAAEAKDPERNLPRAINSIPIRVMLFYILSLAVIMSVTPWNQVSPERSPFVAMYSLAGLAIAASVINFVVLTSATSSANSGIYCTSRMIYGLAQEGDAPRRFAKLNRRLVPTNALFLSGFFLLAAVVMVVVGGSIIEAFTIVSTISSLCLMFVWSMILISYLAYRKKRPRMYEASKFKMPGGRTGSIVMCYVVLAFFVFLVCVFTQRDDTLKALLVTPVWFGVLTIGWAVIRNQPHRLEMDAKFHAELDEP